MGHPHPIPSLEEAIKGLRQNSLFQVYMAHMRTRADKRARAAIMAKEDVDTLRGRAQEMLDLVKDLES